MRYALHVLIVLALALGACKRKEPKSTEASEVKEKPRPEPVAQTPPVAEAPPECQDDRQCTGYLRCYDGACETPPAVEGAARDNMAKITLTSPDGSAASFHVELAVAHHERMRGLMYRRKMHPDFGMLFVFEGDEPRSFWMKNTYIPLDMVFIDSRGVVVSVLAGAEPMTTTPRASEGPARYVLELNTGVAAEKGIVAGAKMTLENVDPELRPE